MDGGSTLKNVAILATLWMILLPKDKAAAAYNPAPVYHPTTNIVTHNSSCGSRFLTGDFGELQSPNFPENYPNNAECNWEITVPEGKKIALKFLSFRVSILEKVTITKMDFILLRLH